MLGNGVGFLEGVWVGSTVGVRDGVGVDAVDGIAVLGTGDGFKDGD